MKNYRFIVNLNAGCVQTELREKAVRDIQLQLLSDKEGMTGLCKNGVMRHFESDICRHHVKYQDFFFQAEDAIEALKAGLDHYEKQNLEEIGSMNVELMLVDDSVSYEQVKQMNEIAAAACIEEYNKNRFKRYGW